MPKTQSPKRLAPQPWTPDSPRRRWLHAISQVRVRSSRRVLTEYACWLEESRELGLGSIELRLSSSRAFLTARVGHDQTCVDRLRRLEGSDVEAFFVSAVQGRGEAVARSLRSGLRLFLRFCTYRGWTSRELVEFVPRVHGYRLDRVPRGISDSDLKLLLGAAEKTQTTLRDRAILLLLGAYGIRRGQVSGLRFEHLDWRRQRIDFPAHKGGRPVRHALLPAVAEALSAYVSDERPAGCDTNHVFLRARLPYTRLGPEAVTYVISRLFRIGAVESRPRSPHALRHAFARRALESRLPYQALADLLGHRSLGSTSIYAKVDYTFLSEAPLEWPEVLR